MVRLATTVVFVLLFCSGCSRIVADYVLHFGSNRGGTPFPKTFENTPEFMQGHVVRVQDDPPVDLMVWIVEPRSMQLWMEAETPPTDPEGEIVRRITTFIPDLGTYGGIYMRTFKFKEGATPKIAPVGTVIVLQGQGGCARTSFSSWLTTAFLSDAGYRVVLPDLRSQGDSTGDELGFIIKDAQDISKVLDWLEQKQLLVEPVGVMGHSYGSAAGGFAGVNDPRIRTAILSGTPMAWRSVLEFQLPQESFVWRIMSEEARERTFQIINERMGDEAYNLDARTFIATTTKPVLLLHGRLDDNVPVEHAIEIHRARPEGTRLVIFEDCDHSSHFWTHFDEVRALCLSWFAEHMKEKEAVASQVGEFDVEND